MSVLFTFRRRVMAWLLAACGSMAGGTLLLANDAVLAMQPPPPANLAPEPTLPPITVRPEAINPNNDFNYTQGTPGSGSVSWGSNAIRSDRDRVGTYNQPAWTTQRPFATSRAYVLPAGQMQVETWARPTWEPNAKPEFRFLHEYAVGLPGRFQLDIYERWNVEANDQGINRANHEGVQLEVRYALADWGEIFLNPTLYAEWVERGGEQEGKPNKYELKLLLSEEVFQNWFYASNLIMEHEVGGEHELELGWSHALSRTIIERRLMGGVEFLMSQTTVAGARDQASYSVTLGPSLQYRPTNRSFLNLVSLFGTTPNSPICQMYVIYGWQFGPRSGPSRGYFGAPASTSGN